MMMDSGYQEVVAVVFVCESAEEEKGREVNEQLKDQQEPETYQRIEEKVSFADSLSLLLTPLF
jgi:hypothetical protein